MSTIDPQFTLSNELPADEAVGMPQVIRPDRHFVAGSENSIV